jgi:NADH:ubiquinone oxidoreductase subunit 4 (subunit M)
MQPTGATDEDEVEAARAANKFDIRRLIGGLFILYSLILIALGIFGSHHIKNKAAGINVDLWTGIGMLVFGALMIFWALKRPVMPEPPETRGQGSGRLRRAPA